MSRVSDQQRWKAVGWDQPLTLEQRAEIIADSVPDLSRDGERWRRIYQRALQQLREVRETGAIE